MAHGYADGILPQAFVIVNDKLYLNLTHGINNAWIRSGLNGIHSGDQKWPELAQRLVKQGDKYWAE